MSEYNQLVSQAPVTSMPSSIPRRPVPRQSPLSHRSRRKYSATIDGEEDESIMLQPLSPEHSRSASPAGKQSLACAPELYDAPGQGPRRYGVWESIGVLGILTLTVGTCLILLSCGFLIFLWSGAQASRNPQGQPPAFWTDLITRGWAPTVVTVCSAALRTAISLQTGLLAAGLAAIVLETVGVHMQDIAVLSVTRAWKSSPWDITPAIFRRASATGSRGILYLTVITVSVSIALVSTFISTILLSDFELRQIAGRPSTESPR